MSKRRRRHSKRRKSSSSTKYSHSPFQFQCPSNDHINTTPAYGNDTSAEKGETDSSHRENIVQDSDAEEETEHHSRSKNKTLSQDTLEDILQNEKNDEEHGIPPPDDRNKKGVTITTSVTIDDREVLNLGRIIFRQSQAPPDKARTSRSMTVTTTKVKCTVSNMEVEIKEVLHSDDPGIKATLVVENNEGKETKTYVHSHWGKCPSPNNDVHADPTIYSQDNRIKETCNFQTDVKKINTNFIDVASNSMQCKEGSECYKSCCEDQKNNKNTFCNYPLCSGYNDTEYPATDGSCSLYTLSDCSLQWTEHSSADTIDTDLVSDIPPPYEFADREYLLEDLTENIAGFQINQTAVNGSNSSHDMKYLFDSRCQNSFDGEQSPNAGGTSEHLSESDSYDPFFMGPKMPMSRSSFTKNFIHNHEGKTWLRNNSIAILESKPIPSCYLEQQSKRRKTFPEIASYSNKMQESLPSYRESISSGTMSSFFMKTCSPLQSGRSGRFCLEDEGPYQFCAERRKSSNFTTCQKPSTSAFGSHTSFNLDPPRSCKNNNPFYPSKSEESTEEVFTKYGKYFQDENQTDEETVILEFSSENDEDCCHIGLMEQGEFVESGFEEELVDIEEQNLELSGETPNTMKDLLIQVTPPSRSSSYEHINYDGLTSNPLNDFDDVTEIPETDLLDRGNPGLWTKKRRGSVMTVIIGDSEQRCIQYDNRPLEISVPERHHRDFFSSVYDIPSVSPILDVDELEADSINDSHIELSMSHQNSLSLETSISIQAKILDRPGSTGQIEDSQIVTKNENPSQQSIRELNVILTETEKKENQSIEKDETTAMPETSGSACDLQRKMSEDKASLLQKTDSAEKQSLPKSPQDKKMEVRKHLKPPADPILKDTQEAESVQEDESDHWAKRRKLFKETKQWSSAGGSSITSNTEDSVNSEDTRSVDLGVRENEDKGFYTETFHSASWIYRGDDVSPNDSPRCLSKRPRPVAIRERTVKITKGMGDYPWGFRIQFSKPILVTEVDTNGAAEEAGLLVGDIVMTVNGTDVTSVPHSEAAALARQGPDTLTLVIGSDISRCPNTPRPACRGYLHKRTQSGFLKGWRKRWFVLKHDGCLYYYKNKKDEGKCRPLEAMKLEGADVGPDTSLGKPFVFKCCPLSGSRIYYYCATSNQEMKRWLEAMERAVHPVTQNHVWVDVSRHNAILPPLAIKNPECLGLLHQMDKNKDVWVQHYCILKDGCLYFYAGIRSINALGGIYLHGYTVSEQPFGSRRSTIVLKPPSEEFKTFYLCAENAAENKRWILALRVSISKWLPLHQAIHDFMNRPPEETRM